MRTIGVNARGGLVCYRRISVGTCTETTVVCYLCEILSMFDTDTTQTL